MMKLGFLLLFVSLLDFVLGRPPVSKPSEEINFKASRVAYIGLPPPADVDTLKKLNPSWRFLPLPWKYYQRLYAQLPPPISQAEARAIAKRMNTALKGKNSFAGGPVPGKDQAVTWWHQCPIDEKTCYGVPIVIKKWVQEKEDD